MIRRKQNGEPTEPIDHYTRLLLEAQDGDSQSFGEVYAELSPVARDFITSFNGQLCPHEREDLVHDAFLAIWEKRAPYRGEASAKTFILAITRNITLKYLSRQKKGIVNAELVSGIMDAEELHVQPVSMESSENSQIIQAALGKLPEAQRRIIELQLSHDSHVTAAKIVGCTPPQFAARLYYARKCLRMILDHLV